MYIGYIYVDERPSFSCQNILSLNACIDPGRPATYTHMQSCDVEAEPLTQYLRPLSLAAAPSPIQRKRAIPRYRIQKTEYRIQQKALSRAKLQRVTYPSYWGRAGDVSGINRPTNQPSNAPLRIKTRPDNVYCNLPTVPRTFWLDWIKSETFWLKPKFSIPIPCNQGENILAILFMGTNPHGDTK